MTEQTFCNFNFKDGFQKSYYRFGGRSVGWLVQLGLTWFNLVQLASSWFNFGWLEEGSTSRSGWSVAGILVGAPEPSRSPAYLTSITIWPSIPCRLYNSPPCHPYLGPCSGLRAILHPSPGRPYAYQGLPDVTTSRQFPTEVPSADVLAYQGLDRGSIQN